MEIYIIRHTKVDVEKDVCYGQSEVPVSDSFYQELADLQNKLSFGVDAVFSSPLSRCKRLAEQFSSNVEFSDLLLEMNFGDWELKKWNDIDQKELNDWMKDFVTIKPKNGENLQILYQRVCSFLEKLQKESFGKVLLVTHAGVIRCVHAYFLGIPLSNIFEIQVKFGEIYSFLFRNNQIINI